MTKEVKEAGLGCLFLIAVVVIAILIAPQFCNGSESETEDQKTTATSSPTRVPPARPTPIPAPSPTPAPTPTFEQSKSEAVEIDYDDLVDPTKWHYGKRIRFVAKIVLVVPLPERGENVFAIRANVTRNAHSWIDEIWLGYTGARLFEGDIFEIVGTFVRLLTYEATSGNEVTVPYIGVVASQRVEEVNRVVVTQTPTPTATSSPAPTATPTPTPKPPSTPAELVERVQHSIVRVKAQSGGAFFGQISAGSGFIFAVEGTTAFIATNHHIIDGSNLVEVQTRDSSTYDALVLGWDAERDVAVLSICCSSDFIALQWGDAYPSKGDSVVAIGYPDSDTGNLIATIGEIRAPDDLSMEHDFIPHSAPLNPGNSGGPLFTMPGGEVVGINTAGGTETLAFYAVPYQAIEAQMEQWQSQLVISAVPTPTPVIPFVTVVGKSFSYTLNEIRDPVEQSDRIKAGNRLVAIDVSLVALVDEAYYNPARFALQDEDGYVWDDWTWPDDIEPGLRDGYLSAGQKVRGWVAFEVPQSSLITSVLVEDSRMTVVIADLTGD